MTEQPRYLKFARALALATTIVGSGAACGSGGSGSPVVADAGSKPDAGAVADAGSAVIDAGETVADAGETVADAGETVADAGEAVADAGEAVADAGEPVADAGEAVADAGETVADAGAPFDCAQCACVRIPGEATDQPECYELGHGDCCVAVGPLPPPDLAV